MSAATPLVADNCMRQQRCATGACCTQLNTPGDDTFDGKNSIRFVVVQQHPVLRAAQKPVPACKVRWQSMAELSAPYEVLGEPAHPDGGLQTDELVRDPPRPVAGLAGAAVRRVGCGSKKGPGSRATAQRSHTDRARAALHHRPASASTRTLRGLR